MNQLVHSLFTVVVPAAIVAAIVGTVAGLLFKKIDRTISGKLSGENPRKAKYRQIQPNRGIGAEFTGITPLANRQWDYSILSKCRNE
jgi:hypothetical protein